MIDSDGHGSTGNVLNSTHQVTCMGAPSPREHRWGQSVAVSPSCLCCQNRFVPCAATTSIFHCRRFYFDLFAFSPVPPPMAPVPEPLPPIATAAPSKSRAVQQEYKSKAGGKSNRRQQNSLAPPSGAAGTPAGIFSIGGSNLAGTYSVHDKGNNGGGAAAGGPGGPGGDATVVIRTEGGAADATKAALEEKAKKRAEARNELRAVIQRKRWEKKKQYGSGTLLYAWVCVFWCVYGAVCIYARVRPADARSVCVDVGLLLHAAVGVSV